MSILRLLTKEAPEDRFLLDKVIETATTIARGMQASYGASDSGLQTATTTEENASIY